MFERDRSRDASLHDNRIRCPVASPLTNDDGRLKDKTMWMPDWLYEHLPHLYAAAALACVMIFGASLVASFSALLFACAATLTLLQRRRARTAPVRRARSRTARR